MSNAIALEDGLAVVRSLLVSRRLDLLVSVKVARVLVEHVREDVLGVLEALHHFQVG